MFQTLQRDYARLATYRARSGFGFLLECLLFDNGFQAVAGYRLASAMKRIGIPALPAFVWRWTLLCTGVDINPRARFGAGLVISHGVGLVVGADVVAGENCLLHHQVTLGAPTVGRIAENPRVGHNVTFGAGAIVLGGVQIGDGAVVGAGALVVSDVPAGVRALAPPARLRDTPVEANEPVPGGSVVPPPPPTKGESV
jgi:serine O-acetyltransferase